MTPMRTIILAFLLTVTLISLVQAGEAVAPPAAPALEPTLQSVCALITDVFPMASGLG